MYNYLFNPLNPKHSSSLPRVTEICCVTQIVDLQEQCLVTPLRAVKCHSLSYKLPAYLGSPSYHCAALIYPKPNYSLQGDRSSDLSTLSNE